MRTLVTLLAMTLFAAPALAESMKLGDLTIENPWSRATPKGAEVGAGYLTIRNDGATSDRLTGATADFANVQVHEMKMSNGVMEMRELPNGVEIPAHGAIKLAPGGSHLMFVALKKPLAKGETLKVTLKFEHAGAATVDFPVRGAGASGAMNGM